MYRSQRIVIVGGGTAGWFSATTLKRFFPKRDITVIESPDIPIIGVGESTLGYFSYWINAMGIDEEVLFKYTDASYKSSIKFTDFYKKDSGGFHYPFGRTWTPPELFGEIGAKAWQYKKVFYPETPPEDYCRTVYPHMTLIENNKINKNENNEFPNFSFEQATAYHFDATKFGIFLRDQLCIPNGVKHIQAEVKKVVSDEDGVKEVVLNDGRIIKGDLFIDCTGWKSMLLGQEMGEEFLSYDHLIPNNKAWATKLPYTDKEKELEPYTNCTALGNGWAWNIPLWSRIGTGYVYSDKYISKEDALKEFKKYLRSDKMAHYDPNRNVEDLEFKDINMKIGIHRRTWVKNVVAIGLSAGFIEPLESTGLYTVHEFLMQLVNYLEREEFNQFEIDSYNATTRLMFDGLCKFVAMHYSLSLRDDTEYWKDVRKRSYADYLIDEVQTNQAKELQYCVDQFGEIIARKSHVHEHNVRSGNHCILNGMNYNILSLQNVLSDGFYNYAPKIHECKKTLDDMMIKWEQQQKKYQKIADESPTLMQYLHDNFYKKF